MAQKCAVVAQNVLFFVQKWSKNSTNVLPQHISFNSAIAMWILQGHLYGRTRTVQVKSGMSIDSHPESCVFVQTASPYSPGKYVNWNLSFFNGDPVYSYVNSSRSPVRPYKNCTGQVWYVHWFSSGELRFGPNG